MPTPEQYEYFGEEPFPTDGDKDNGDFITFQIGKVASGAVYFSLESPRNPVAARFSITLYNSEGSPYTPGERGGSTLVDFDGVSVSVQAHDIIESDRIYYKFKIRRVSRFSDFTEQYSVFKIPLEEKVQDEVYERVEGTDGYIAYVLAVVKPDGTFLSRVPVEEIPFLKDGKFVPFGREPLGRCQ